MHVLCGTVAWIFRFGVSTTKTFNQSNIWILQRRAWWNNNDCYIWNLFPDVFSWRYGCLSPTQNLNLIVPISRDVDPTFLCLDLLEVTWLMEEILMDSFYPTIWNKMFVTSQPVTRISSQNVWGQWYTVQLPLNHISKPNGQQTHFETCFETIILVYSMLH